MVTQNKLKIVLRARMKKGKVKGEITVGHGCIVDVRMVNSKVEKDV